MSRTRAVLTVVFALFLGYTAWVAIRRDPPLLEYLASLGPGSWGMQILLDLAIALGLVCAWLIRDARRRGRRAWPWVVGTPVFGSLAPLLYLLQRKKDLGTPVAHWELWTKDPGRISKFLTDAFGWSVRFIPEMNYRLVHSGGTDGPSGGIMTPLEGPWPGNMAFYIDVDDLAAYNRRIVAAGGKIVVERLEIPVMGAMSLFADPDGRVLGLWQRR